MGGGSAFQNKPSNILEKGRRKRKERKGKEEDDTRPLSSTNTRGRRCSVFDDANEWWGVDSGQQCIGWYLGMDGHDLGRSTTRSQMTMLVHPPGHERAANHGSASSATPPGTTAGASVFYGSDPDPRHWPKRLNSMIVLSFPASPAAISGRESLLPCEYLHSPINSSISTTFGPAVSPTHIVSHTS